VMSDNAWAYVHNRFTGRTARPARNPAPQDRALPAPDQRQGRALPPNDGAGMGLRTQLPLTRTPQPSPARMAQPLQPDPTPQLARRPTPNQPRSQPTWAGQLDSAPVLLVTNQVG
jgi:hypothetical protein